MAVGARTRVLVECPECGVRVPVSGAGLGAGRQEALLAVAHSVEIDQSDSKASRKVA